jgi:hypothetical protein
MSFLGAQNSIALGVQGLIHIDTGVVGSADYLLAKSLRFRSSASAYLNRTPSVAGSSQKLTWSGWVKRGTLSSLQYLYSVQQTGTADDAIYFSSTDTLAVTLNNGTNSYTAATSGVFRDPAAWYHVIVAIDTTQATQADRVAFYINGSLQAQASNNIPSAYTFTGFDTTKPHNIARYVGATNPFDGELAEVNFVDGQALAPTAFGATGANSQWLPKAYTGTYGTNGFYLPFTNTTSTSTLVADSSGNGNNWTPNNISLTAGSTYDSLTDVPTLTSETVANYAVLNPLNIGTASSLSNGNLTFSSVSSSGNIQQAQITGTFAIPSSGKWYFESTPTSLPVSIYIGVAIVTQSMGSTPFSGTPIRTYRSSTGYKSNGVTDSAYGNTYTTSDVIGVAVDMDAGAIYFYKNNTIQNSGNAAFTDLAGTTWMPYCVAGSSASTVTGSFNFGQQPFVYPTLPTGFLPLNTFNIAAGTVTTSGTFTGNLSTDGPMVYLNGTPTAMTINGNAVTFGTHADKLANGFKVRSSSVLYNLIGSNTYVATTVAEVLKYENAQPNP